MCSLMSRLCSFILTGRPTSDPILYMYVSFGCGWPAGCIFVHPWVSMYYSLNLSQTTTKCNSFMTSQCKKRYANVVGLVRAFLCLLCELS